MKIRNLVNKGVFVSNLQPWNPPVLHIWVIPVGNVNAPSSRAIGLHRDSQSIEVDGGREGPNDAEARSPLISSVKSALCPRA